MTLPPWPYTLERKWWLENGRFVANSYTNPLFCLFPKRKCPSQQSVSTLVSKQVPEAESPASRGDDHPGKLKTASPSDLNLVKPSSFGDLRQSVARQCQVPSRQALCTVLIMIIKIFSWVGKWIRTFRACWVLWEQLGCNLFRRWHYAKTGHQISP